MRFWRYLLALSNRAVINWRNTKDVVCSFKTGVIPPRGA